MNLKEYSNPILRGFYPDPSICRVGMDYYLVTSTFEYFPGLPIFHSKDLVNWEQVGHGFSRPTQMKISDVGPNGMGIFAPTIRYINGRFYIVCTNVSHESLNKGNFLIWTDDIRGEWSDPIWLDLPGIDPSLFVDDDGTVYYSGTDGGIYLVELNLETGETSERRDIWFGTGAADPEGPHLYKKDGYYYLVISEGGTSYGHMISLARSRDINGPYEVYEKNPVLTNRSTGNPLQAVGHADLFEDINGNWWAVCLAIRPSGYPLTHILGRETSLIPVTWKDGEWPSFGKDGHLYLEMEGPIPETDWQPKMEKTDWLSLYTRHADLITQTPEGFLLHPNRVHLSDNAMMSWIGRRQQELNCTFEATIKLNFDAEAGITTYLNPFHHYDLSVKREDGEYHLRFYRQIGSLRNIEKQQIITGEMLTLRIVATSEMYFFSYQVDGREINLFGQGETKYLSTEVGGRFTGLLLGIFATETYKTDQTISVTNIRYD